MTTGIGPYVVPLPTDTDPAPGVLETTIIASHAMVDIGGSVTAHAETFNGAIPGPALLLNVNDTAIVRLVNDLGHPVGIHWHGIELASAADGTEVTQEGVAARFPTPPAPPAPPGGTYLYKFTLPRPGIFWYHPHHHHSTNRVFKGMYGMIVVADPHEAALIASGVLPGPAGTKQLVLSDITVCKSPGSNDATTYPDPTTIPVPDRPEWLSGATSQGGPTPVGLCEIPPAGSAQGDHGGPAAASYAAGEIPSIVLPGQTNEGQTVLTNGMVVGGRAGTPTAPGALSAGAAALDVQAGQGLRLQIANCATIRYFRLILTDALGTQIPLVRVGGEGGLLDNAVVEGGISGTFDTKYFPGEILLPAGSRADVVAAIPATATGPLTLWTRDYPRTGPNNPGSWARLPTVPVLHLNIVGTAPTAYTIGAGTPLRAAIPGAAVETLGPPTATLLDPATFTPAEPGMANPDIQITTPPGINGVVGGFEGFAPYSSAPHIGSSRFAASGGILELTVTNSSQAHHPFHLHGFSIQPLTLAGPTETYTWPYREFRDNIDIPGQHTLTFRVHLADRPLKDGLTLGGALGRWLFHCHIFFHHHQGMISELVVTSADGSEKPHVDVGGTWVYTPLGGIATRAGTYHHPDGDPVALTASAGSVTDLGGGKWAWSLDTTGMPAQTQYVYITGADPGGRRDQTVFRLKVGGPDDGADNGDPHVHTVDGVSYDFQGVGEFTLLRDTEDTLEIQARHWPVPAANPVTDPHTGLTSCVSVNTAVAARIGEHRISYQMGPKGKDLLFFRDGEPTDLPRRGLDLPAGRVSTFAVASGATGVRVDFANQSVLVVTPYFWNSHGIWILNVAVSHTQADMGLMGAIPPGSWLPRLPSGATLGPKPTDPHDRYVQLYRTFADAWRVTDQTSLFTYEPGTSTADHTDRGWPAEKPPCQLLPQFSVFGAPVLPPIPLRVAARICRVVADPALRRDCTFDVATTGDKDLVEAYLAAEQFKAQGTAVQLVAEPAPRPGEPLQLTATVTALGHRAGRPRGAVRFLLDGEPIGSTVKLDKLGRATQTTPPLPRGDHTLRAEYRGGGKRRHLPSSSPPLMCQVEPPGPTIPANPTPGRHPGHGPEPHDRPEHHDEHG